MTTYSSVLLLIGLLCPLVWSQVRPPNLSPDNLPDTAFTCEDKVTGGYYADVEADCQLFHVCVQVSEYEFQDFHFLCPNDTVFDQQHLVCTNWFEVDCHAQLAFFSNDFGIKRGGADRDVKLDEDVQIRPEPQQGSRLRNSGRGQLEVGRRRPGAGQQRRVNSGRARAQPVQEQPEESISLLASITGSTPIPLGFTTTVRPPRAIENNGGFLSGRNLIRNHEEKEEIDNSNDDVEEEEVDRFPASSFPKFGIDGRRPKVKANIRAKLANKGKKAFFQKFDKPTKKSGRKVNLDHKRKNRIEFVEPTEEEETDFEFSGPELRPDGRVPRVKSNIFAEQPNTRPEPEITTVQSFIDEPFFASPSSPAPFIFRGTPDPYAEQDLFGSASTSQPFFPTVKSQASASSDSPQPSQDESSRPSDRFQARPSPKRGRNKVVVETNLSEVQSSTNTNIREKALKTRTRKNRVKAAFAAANALNSIEPQSESECNNPFDCPPKFLAAGRRPRVKSNLQARKRNFWQKTKVGGKLKLGEFGVGQGRRGRKIRRGRKQRIEKPAAAVETNEQETELANLINDAKELPEPIEPFVPTTRTTSTTTQPVQEEENEIFDDFFDHQNDFFAASSTISPVVFKGTPGPGFFSSPQPFFGNEGQQVSFTSPNPFGPSPAGGRPSFNNIGAHIDLGPQKPADQLLFISSTVSNKIVIGSEEEPTTPLPSLPTRPAKIDFSSGRNFPSFPIRGDGAPSIKSKLDFSRRNKPTFKFAKPSTEEVVEEEEREENVTEQNEFPSTEQSTTTTTTATPTTTSDGKTQFVVAKSQTKGKFPRVKSNLLFNRKNKERFRLKLAQLSARKTSTTTTTTTTTPADPTPSTTSLASTGSPASSVSPTVSENPSEAKVSLFKPRKKFNLRKKPSFFSKVPDVSITNNILKFRNRAKFNSKTAEEEAEEIPTTVGEAAEVSTESVLSVEAELADDEDEKVENVKLGGKVDPVRKAKKAPLNGNIRVEFKKKTVEELLGTRGRFSINPDGRKPRVKSNIRAHLANRGQHHGGQHQLEESGETFDGASSQLDLTPFNKVSDNNNKREVNSKEAPVNLISTEDEVSEQKPSKPSPVSFSLPLLPLQPVILNPRQATRSSSPPPLPAAILNHINHITDIRSLPPLPPVLRQTESGHGLEDGIFAEDDEAVQISREGPSHTRTGLLDQILVVNSNEKSQIAESPVQVGPRTAGEGVAGGASSKLSAFRALQQQTISSQQSQVSLV